jgi:hypothetical protein
LWEHVAYVRSSIDHRQREYLEQAGITNSDITDTYRAVHVPIAPYTVPTNYRMTFWPNPEGLGVAAYKRCGMGLESILQIGNGKTLAADADRRRPGAEPDDQAHSIFLERLRAGL